MFKFKQIEYIRSLHVFENAEKSGLRMKMGEFNTSQWLQHENIKFDDIVNFSKQMPDAKIFIIGSGTDRGFYIYSQKQQTCYKFEHQLEAV
ncbi:MAG: hypothetical protein RBS73_15060 [Prolixibacteraceae bacterium]|jgi:hypothetical protein|nr:hypothetical protein [Prolixibacteraceae bacterium]